MGPLVPLILGLGESIIKRVWPDPADQAKAQLELLKLTKDQELESVRLQLSAIIAEAQSNDPWTSRARPSFLYVMYIMLLAGIPMGFLAAFRPEMAAAVAHGMQAWLAAIPDALYALFGVGYTGYTGARMFEKRKGLK